MPFYVWWAIPLVATLIAVAWLSWRARDRPIDPHDSVAERRRFIAAMEQPSSGRGNVRAPRADAAGRARDDEASGSAAPDKTVEGSSGVDGTTP